MKSFGELSGDFFPKLENGYSSNDIDSGLELNIIIKFLLFSKYFLFYYSSG